MKKIHSNTLSTGFAMFSMFFGAGNVVFPLILGQQSQNLTFYAILGLMITAVFVPFTGLMSMTLFNGDSKDFFSRTGKISGLLLITVIMALIGPLGAMPRVISLSFSTTKMFIPSLVKPWFSLGSCLLIFLFTYRRSRILDLLGYLLTPLLLGSLFLLVAVGIYTAPELSVINSTPAEQFWNGALEGYNTMDLLGAFFFCSVVILCLKREFHTNDQANLKKLLKMTFQASCIGAFLLAIVYIGFTYTAAYHSQSLVGVSKDALLGTLALNVLGPYAGIVAIVAVALACLTTAIALAAVFAEFLHEEITQKKLGYFFCLIITLIATYFISLLEFGRIVAGLAQILKLCYPALIVLSLCNIAEKLWGFHYTKLLFWTTFSGTLAYYIIY